MKRSKHLTSRATVAAAVGAAALSATLTLAGTAPVASAAVHHGLKKGLKVFVIPKNLGNSYFTTADSVKTGGALAALAQLGEQGQETSGTVDTPSAQLPVIQADISKGANALIISATDPTALCPTLEAAMKKGITVVTYDSDAPTCRTLFVNQATAQALGESEVQILASEIHDAGQIAVVSAGPSDTNQNTWIQWMKVELKKYPKMHLVSVVYGMDETSTDTSVTQGLLSHYPDLKGIIAPTTVAMPAAAAVIDGAHDKGKIMLTGLATPDEMKQYVANGTVSKFELWDPASLGYLAAYAAVELASKAITPAEGQHFVAGKLGSFTVGPDHTVLLGAPYVFDKANIDNFNF